MADNKKRGRFGKGSEESAQSIFDLFEPPPDQEVSSFGRIPIIRDEDEGAEEESLDLTNVEFVEAQAAAEAEAAGLQHWTEPATGQIPASLAAEGDDNASEMQGPSWQGEDQGWAGPDLADVFADTEAISHQRTDSRLSPDEPTIDPAPPRPAGPTPARRSPEASSLFDLEDRAPVRGTDDVRRAQPAPPQPQRQPAPQPQTAPPQPQRQPAPQETQPQSAPQRQAAPQSQVPDPVRSDLPLPESRGGQQPPPRRPIDLSEPMSAAQRERADRERQEFARPAAPDSMLSPAPVPAPTSRLGSTLRPNLDVEPPPRGAHDAVPRRTPAPQAPPAPENREPRSQVPPPARGVLGPQPEPRERPVAPAQPRVERGGMFEDELPPLDDLEYDDGGFEDYPEERAKPRIDRGLGQRIIVGVALGAVVAVALGLGPLATMALICVVTLLATMELFNAMRLAGLRPATLLGLVGAVALPAASYVRGDAGYPLVVGLAVVFGMLWYLTGADTERPVLNLGLTLTGILWIGGMAGFAALMVREDGGIGVLLATIIITVCSDALAYLGGRAYGTKPFHEASPNKSWEGTFTGFFGALLAGLVIGVTDLISVFESSFMSIIVLAAVVGVLAPIGDLAESLIKRDLGIKDMGTLLPGHGGVLDRVDGLLFALPGAYYVAVIYNLF